MNPTDATRWSAPNTYPSWLDDGVRLYALNGILPVVANTTLAAAVQYATHQSIPTRFVSRGYESAADDLLQNPRLTIDLQTWNPDTEISAITGGVEEEHVLATERTQDRLAYHYGTPGQAFDGTNASGDFLTKGRKDYSVKMGTGGVTHLHLGGGVRLDLHQETRFEQVAPVDRAQSLQVKIENNQGRIRIMALRLDSGDAGQRQGELA